MRFNRKPPLYVLPHGIEVIGEYALTAKNPYWRVRIRPHPFFPNVRNKSDGIGVKKSRVVLAAKLGRALTIKEHAHHGEEGPHTDLPENLTMLSPAEHNRHHKTGSKHRPDSKAKTSATLKAAYASGEIVPSPCIGTANGCAKLDDDKVREIRSSSVNSAALGRKFGVSKQVVLSVRHNRTWRHVT